MDLKPYPAIQAWFGARRGAPEGSEACRAGDSSPKDWPSDEAQAHQPRALPYVQRAVIALTEKGVDFERIDIDLANKPDWFLKLSPLGKVPVLVDGDTVIFESAVIVEYWGTRRAEDPPGRPDRARLASRLDRVRSAILNDIAGLYSAPIRRRSTPRPRRCAPSSTHRGRLKGPWFDGERFNLVDACSVRCSAISMRSTASAISASCRAAEGRRLAPRARLARLGAAAVSPGYPALLWEFLRTRGSHLSRLMESGGRRRRPLPA